MEKRAGFRTWIAQGYALLNDLSGLLRSLKEAIDMRDALIFHVTGPYHDCLDINGVKLERIYNSDEVQNLLAGVNLDKQSISRLRV